MNNEFKKEIKIFNEIEKIPKEIEKDIRNEMIQEIYENYEVD